MNYTLDRMHLIFIYRISHPTTTEHRTAISHSAIDISSKVDTVIGYKTNLNRL